MGAHAQDLTSSQVLSSSETSSSSSGPCSSATRFDSMCANDDAPMMTLSLRARSIREWCDSQRSAISPMVMLRFFACACSSSSALQCASLK